MWKPLAILLLCLTAPTPASTPEEVDFTDRVIAFHQSWDPFFRSYFGCPRQAITTDECKPVNALLDRSQYATARKAAKKLFDLEDHR